MALIFYDRDGVPISVYRWMALLERDAYRCVRRTKVTSAADLSQSCDVSTIWLGLDQGCGLLPGVGVPLIFETMIFAEGSEHDRDCERWPTLASALAGHVRVVTMMATTMDDPVVMDVDPDEQDYDIVCANGCPEGAAGQHKFSCPESVTEQDDSR